MRTTAPVQAEDAEGLGQEGVVNCIGSLSLILRKGKHIYCRDTQSPLSDRKVHFLNLPNLHCNFRQMSSCLFSAYNALLPSLQAASLLLPHMTSLLPNISQPTKVHD